MKKIVYAYSLYFNTFVHPINQNHITKQRI
jgi:hypothetical protein